MNMRISLFILNIVSAILLISLAFSNPSITGFATTLTDAKSTFASPLAFANIFIIITLSLDVYFYLKSKYG